MSAATFKQKVGYLNTDVDACTAVKLQLQALVDNDMFSTVSSYNANAALYPGNVMTFVEKHVHYLNTHPKLDAESYIANLRLMTRVR